MAQVTINRLHDGEYPSVFDEIKAAGERIRQYAYNLFRRRGENEGSALDDWLQAERELIWAPPAELTEKDGSLNLQIAVPGFQGKDLQITTTENTLVVKGAASHKHEKSDGDVHFCEFCQNELFRSFDLPASIDVDKVTARLENGILYLAAPKKQANEKQVPVAA